MVEQRVKDLLALLIWITELMLQNQGIYNQESADILGEKVVVVISANEY